MLRHALQINGSALWPGSNGYKTRLPALEDLTHPYRSEALAGDSGLGNLRAKQDQLMTG